jgi:hypothetical protein
LIILLDELDIDANKNIKLECNLRSETMDDFDGPRFQQCFSESYLKSQGELSLKSEKESSWACWMIYFWLGVVEEYFLISLFNLLIFFAQVQHVYAAEKAGVIYFLYLGRSFLYLGESFFYLGRSFF